MFRLTLRTRMALLVLAGVLPLTAYNLSSVYLNYRHERSRASQQALSLARSLAEAVEGVLRERIAALDVLSRSRDLVGGDLVTFRGQAEALLAHLLPGASILLVGEDGRLLMNTAAAASEPLPPRLDLENQRRVFATGQPSVSDVYMGSVLHRPVVAIDVPVLGSDGRVAMVLALNPSLVVFDAVIRRHRPGEGWIIAVVDRKGVRVARQPDPERFLGQPLTPDLLPLWLASPEGIVEAISPDGALMLTAFTRMPQLGWGVVVAVPVAELTNPAWRAALISLLVGGGLLALGLLLARWASLGILRPIAGLRRLAASADEYNGVAGTEGTGLPETDEVAVALRAEARRRLAATASLLDSERRLQLVVAELNHRAKNALATVQSLALQTARTLVAGDAASFTEAFTARLQSLARAHDLLVAFHWEPAALNAVVQAGLAPWLHRGDAERIVLRYASGQGMPPAAPGQAQAVVMALHELATNASKYGALSVSQGWVEVEYGAEDGGQTAIILWRELGGPPVPGPPKRHGFGTRLLERALPHDLGPGASVSMHFDPEGVRAAIRFKPRHVTHVPGDVQPR